MRYEVDIKLKESFRPEDLANFTNLFKTYDKNKNALLEKEELLDLLHSLGHRNLKAGDINTLISGVKTADPNSLTFTEYLNLMKKLVDKDGNIQVDKFISKSGKAMVRVSKGDSGFQYQTFSEEERTAYVKVINSSLADDPVCQKYLPIDPNTN